MSSFLRGASASAGPSVVALEPGGCPLDDEKAVAFDPETGPGKSCSGAGVGQQEDPPEMLTSRWPRGLRGLGLRAGDMGLRL